MKGAAASRLGKEVCEALGLDPAEVMSLTIELAPRDVATVTAVCYIDDTFTESIRRYKLTPIDEEDES